MKNTDSYIGYIGDLIVERCETGFLVSVNPGLGKSEKIRAINER